MYKTVKFGALLCLFPSRSFILTQQDHVVKSICSLLP